MIRHSWDDRVGFSLRSDGWRVFPSPGRTWYVDRPDGDPMRRADGARAWFRTRKAACARVDLESPPLVFA